MALPNVTIGRGRDVTDPIVTVGQAHVEESSIAAATLVITEMTGEKRTVTLNGRAMPYQPMGFEGEHRIEEMAAAGFSHTTQQPTGPQELPSQWKGRWKDRYLGDIDPDNRGGAPAQIDQAESELVDGAEVVSVSSTAIRRAAALCEVFDDIRLKGQLLRVSFLHLTRVGRLKRFRQDWINQYDVEWQAEFVWIGKDVGADLPSPNQPSLTNITQQMSAAYAEVEEATAFSGLPSLNTSVADTIDVHVAELSRIVGDIEGNLEARVGGALDAPDAMRRALSSITALRDESELCLQEIAGRVSATFLQLERDYDQTTATAGHVIAAQCIRQRAIRASRKLKHRAARTRFTTMKALDANLLAIVLCKQEQDLRTLSTRYYGNPEDWHLIREFNGFDSSLVPVGTVVLVPVKQ